jgi:adenosyl cobinamide kinase/adenosyl cobinamide phosphate guanylyltransferase
VITLILGGAGSGKSATAERLVAQLAEPVTFVATWAPDPTDLDMAARVAAHRARRPSSWSVRECGRDLPAVARSVTGTMLIDSLGTWVAGADPDGSDAPALCAALRDRSGDTVIVSDEVGLGVHPSTEAGRHFRDTLGLVNQAVAAVADRVWLVVAGRTLVLGEP